MKAKTKRIVVDAALVFMALGMVAFIGPTTDQLFFWALVLIHF